MKHKLSITVDEELVVKIQDKLREGSFRNKSHIVEYSLKKFLEGEER